MKNVSDILTGNMILNLSILAWVTAQVLKVLLILILNHRWDWRQIMSSGGMPSSHSAFVCACAASVGMMQGFSSVNFAISTVLAVVVMYDASNVRRAAGEQAKILNYMMDHWKEMRPEFFGRELKELLGHTPFQVLMGGLLGISIGLGGIYFWG